MIRDFLETKILKTQSRKDAVTLVSGTTIAQVMTIGAAPILSRLYTPEQFGILALFMSLTALLSSVSTGRYELAVVLPEEDDDAKALFHLGMLINICLSAMVLIAVVIGNNWISAKLGSPGIGPWLYFLPLVIFMTGLFNMLNYYNTRLGTYGELAQVKVIRAFLSSSIQILMGYFVLGLNGLVVGNIAGNFIGNTRLFKRINDNGKIFSEISKKKMIAVGKRYIDFPKISTFSIFVNQAHQNVTSLLLPALFSVGTLGFYSLANKILGLPSSLIGDSVKQVFMRNAAKARQKKGHAKIEFDITLRSLILVTIPIFIVLYFVSVPLFTFVFGPEWREAGIYAQILLPYFLVKFISSNMSTTMVVFEKQSAGLITQLYILLVSASTMIYAYWAQTTVEGFLSLFSIMLSITYASLIFYYRRVAAGDNLK